MRISRLDLRAYGLFTERTLTFGSGPGLHLVYGENEAGKSTTLRAISSVLFGYPRELMDDFRHGSKDMTLGAELVFAEGRRLEFVRKRTGKNSLVDSGGAPLDEATLAEALGPASRELFEKVFALDHRRLREQAQSLLADGGALGFSLAEAGSGIAGLKTVLDRLRAQRAELFLGGGSKPKLNQLIKKRAETLKEARLRSVSPVEYGRQQKQIQDAEDRLSDARERQKKLGVEVARLRRIDRNLPRRAEHAGLSQTLDELAAVPVLALDVTEKRIKSQSERDTAERTLKSVSADLEKLSEEIAAVSIDARLLERREEIASLAETRPGIEKAERDLPRRQTTLAEHLAKAELLMRQAELRGDPADLDKSLASSLKRKAITRLGEQGRRLEAQHTAAAAQLAQAQAELERAERHAAECPDAAETALLVKRSLSAADKLGDITAQIFKRRAALERKSALLTLDVKAMGISPAEVAALRSFAVPPEKTIDRYDETFGALDREIRRSSEERAHAEEEIALSDRKIAALKSSGEVVSEVDLAVARRTRDRSWALVRYRYVASPNALDKALEQEITSFAPDGTLADAYGIQVREADRLVDVLRGNVERVTTLALLERQLQEARVASERAKSELGLLAGRRTTLQMEWAALWPGITAHLPAEMREWVARRKIALSAGDELAEERDELAALQQRRSQTIERLLGVVAFARPDPPCASEADLDELRERAREALGQLDETNARSAQARAALESQRRLVSQAGLGLQASHSQLEGWRQGWTEALRAGTFSESLSIEAATATIEVMNDLDVVNSSIRTEQHRIERIGSDRTAFLAEFETLSHLAPLASADPLEKCRALETALRDSEAAETKRTSLLEQSGKATAARDEAREILDRSRRILDALCRQAGCSDPVQLAGIEEKSALKREAQRRRLELESRMREDGAGLDLPALFAECDGRLGDEIPIAVDTAEKGMEEISRVVDDELKRRAGLLSDLERLLNGSQAADCMQQAAHLDAEIAESAENYVSFTFQEILLERAVALYRDRNQGPILARATGLFRDLTGGAYSGLRADVDERGEPIVIAEHATRGALDVAALSEGTVDSLYLALRLAAVELHNATREPLPFVADDLLLNLDDTRACAAFLTLSRLAESNQVLFFTHHAHMRDLAQRSVPKDRLFLHELAPSL